MNKHLFALGLVPVLALGACGTTETNTSTTIENGIVTESMTSTTANDAMLTGVPASPGQAFANTAGASDFYEVEAGKLAQQKATTQALKDFGGMMVTGHTKSTEDLKAAGARATPAIVPDPALTAEQEANLETLRSATGADFDTAYKSQQVVAHEKTLAVMKDYAANGDVPELKKFAADTSKVVQMHLDKIKGM
jgi:putative membrane protein